METGGNHLKEVRLWSYTIMMQIAAFRIKYVPATFNYGFVRSLIKFFFFFFFFFFIKLF